MGIQDTFKALSDPTRREILTLLKAGSLTAGEICDKFSVSGATISHHLSVMRDAGMISSEKKGKYIYYELNTTVIDELVGWVFDFKGGTNNEKDK